MKINLVLEKITLQAMLLIGGGGGAALKNNKKVFYTQTFSNYLLIEYNQYSAMVTD